eukprot:CAMPEP_0169094390 /NCGR_PEP_ID=MMETSP1015-20121227/17927_1 /TAXON_ID=342587 /ORGANISM="Karlodinium micrum, Strain CCMP2283" /LENGTH=270 /DNA_ID=CAMNT_0009155059 /DNA_START=76 /DNA_END=885 /DNA_ORIENTATION=-
MNTFICAVLFFGCLGHAQNQESPRESLAEFLLAQHPTKARQGQGPKAVRARKSPAMEGRAMSFFDDPNEMTTDEDAFAFLEDSQPAKLDVKEMAGVTGPLGFFDPVGFSKPGAEPLGPLDFLNFTTNPSAGRIKFYREAELKHGRLGMLAALGFLVSENFHPMFGGNIDGPALKAFEANQDIADFQSDALFVIFILEMISLMFTFNTKFSGDFLTMRDDHVPGGLGFDPLNLKPKDPEEFKAMQTKELNNGRLGMLAAAGMIAQEMVSGQ